MIKNFITHNFQLIDNPQEYSHQDWRDLDRNYNILVNRVNSFLNPSTDTIVIENLDESIQSCMLFQILNTLGQHNQIPIIIVKSHFEKLPSFIKRDKNTHLVFCTPPKFKKKQLDQAKVKIFSPFMLHNCLDGKFQDSVFTKITYYPFKDFTLKTLGTIAAEYFEYITDEEKWEQFYTDVLSGNTTPEVLQVYKVFNKTSPNLRVVLVHSIPDISAYANFLNFNSNVLPVYMGKDINPIVLNYYVRNISQRAPAAIKDYTTQDIEQLCQEIIGSLHHPVCAQLGTPTDEVAEAINKYLTTYSVEKEVAQYGTI